MVNPSYQNQDYATHDENFHSQIYFIDLELSPIHELQAEKILFESMKDNLKKDLSLSGKFIAIHQGNVVDSDFDQIELIKRLQSTYGKRPILIEKLDEQLVFTSSPSL